MNEEIYKSRIQKINEDIRINAETLINATSREDGITLIEMQGIMQNMVIQIAELSRAQTYLLFASKDSE